LVESDHRYTSPSYTRPYPLAVKRAWGCHLEDLDGNVFLDFTAGIAVCATGHCHPRVVEAIRRQAGELVHMCGADFYLPPLRDLARRLTEIAPGSSPRKVLFTNSGAEAIEAAIKLARYRTRRPYILAFYGGFHGRTLGALALTASKPVQRRGFQPMMPGVVHVAFPDPYRGAYGALGDAASTACLRFIEEHLFRTAVPPDEIAALVVEPIQGEGGYIVPPPDFHPRLKELAARHGILYIADEIQTGIGRTGRMFALDHWGVEPDVLCLAKGLASGMPLGAIVAREELMDWPPGAHASTFGGNPVSCAAALETINLVQEELAGNAATVGAGLLEGLRSLQNRHAVIGHVRGMGLMLAIDLVQDRTSKRPVPKLRDAVVQQAFHRGLLLLGCGESAIRLCPPLVLTAEEAAAGLEILDAALAEAPK
jgi:4-aminobutyrate aminotransferase